MYSVFLDTNIYRSLGLKFAKHRDYETLDRFLAMSGHDFGLIGVVKRELLDYYQKDVFGKAFVDYKRAVKQIDDNPFLKKLPVPDFDEMLKEANRILEIDLDVFMSTDIRMIPAEDLTRFLLFNKAEKRTDNARDFMIFYNLMRVCRDDKTRTVVLISQDKIFRQNAFFLEEIKKKKITNFQVYESIGAFMAVAGTKVEWLTKEMVLKHIDRKVIDHELRDDITCLPSYVSKYYYEKDGSDLPEFLKMKLGSIEIEDFYVYRSEEDQQLKVNVDLRVKTYAVFGSDPYPEQLRQFLLSKPEPTIEKPETFDEKGNVIYNEDVLFLFSGEINEAKQRIENMRFIDFMPAYFRYENWQPGFAYQLLPITTKNIEPIIGLRTNPYL
jgi:hypothetical protein